MLCVSYPSTIGIPHRKAKGEKMFGRLYRVNTEQFCHKQLQKQTSVSRRVARFDLYFKSYFLSSWTKVAIKGIFSDDDLFPIAGERKI